MGIAFDSENSAPHDSDMNARVAKLEADLTAIKIDLAVIKANGASKSDIADCKAAISEAKFAIVLWVAGIVFLAQLLPPVVRLLQTYF